MIPRDTISYSKFLRHYTIVFSCELPKNDSNTATINEDGKLGPLIFASWCRLFISRKTIGKMDLNPGYNAVPAHLIFTFPNLISFYTGVIINFVRGPISPKFNKHHTLSLSLPHTVQNPTLPIFKRLVCVDLVCHGKLQKHSWHIGLLTVKMSLWTISVNWHFAVYALFSFLEDKRIFTEEIMWSRSPMYQTKNPLRFNPKLFSLNNQFTWQIS